MKSTTCLLLLAGTLFLQMTNPACAEERVFDFSQKAIDLEVTADFDVIRSFRAEMLKVGVTQEDFETPAYLKFSKEGSVLGEFQAKINPRGLTRNFNCTEYPPFKINFKKDDMPGTLFEGLDDKLKVVTHCRRYAGEDITLEESQAVKNLKEELYRYLAYSHFHPNFSYRVQLLRITYKEAGKADVTSFGFLIEHKKDIKKRTGYKYIKPSEAPCTQEELDEIYAKECSYTSLKFVRANRQTKALDALFRKYNVNPREILKITARYYLGLALIGGTSDHSFAGNNSTVFYKVSDEGALDVKVVPYDFDRIDSVPLMSFDWFHSYFSRTMRSMDQMVQIKAFENIRLQTEKLSQKATSFYNDFYLNTQSEATLTPPFSIYNFTRDFTEFYSFASRYPDIWFSEIVRQRLLP